MEKKQFMAMSQNTGLMCEVSYFEDGVLTTTKIKPVSGFSVEKNNICDYMIRFGYSDNIEFRTEKTFKPILYPLSDYEKLGLDITDEITIQNIIDKRDIIGNMKLNLAQQLIEAHFDIAGLIEKGEAIDVNTFSINPYK